jgi:hypothetical protein
MADFDPYHRWLGIPIDEQPPNFYRLLGLVEFESDGEVIQDAADRQMSHVKRYAAGAHREVANQILNELAKAQLTLLDPNSRKEYDRPIKRARKKAKEKEKQKRLEAENRRLKKSEKQHEKELKSKTKNEVLRTKAKEVENLATPEYKLAPEPKPAAVHRPKFRPVNSSVDLEKGKSKAFWPLVVVWGLCAIGAIGIASLFMGNPDEQTNNVAQTEPLSQKQKVENKKADWPTESARELPSERAGREIERKNPTLPPITIHRVQSQTIPELLRHRLKLETNRTLQNGERFFLVAPNDSGIELTVDGWLTWTPSEEQGPGEFVIEVAIKKDAELLNSTKIKYLVEEVDSPPLLVRATDEISLFTGDSSKQFVLFFDEDSKYEGLVPKIFEDDVDIEIQVMTSPPPSIQNSLSQRIFEMTGHETNADNSKILQLTLRTRKDTKGTSSQFVLIDKNSQTKFSFPFVINTPFQVIGKHDSSITHVYAKNNSIGAFSRFSEQNGFTLWRGNELVAQLNLPEGLRNLNFDIMRCFEENNALAVWSVGATQTPAKHILDKSIDSNGLLQQQEFDPILFEEQGLDLNPEHNYLLDEKKISCLQSNQFKPKVKGADGSIGFVDGQMTTFTKDGKLLIWTNFDVVNNRDSTLSKSTISLPGANETGRVIRSQNLYCCFTNKITPRPSSSTQWKAVRIYDVDHNSERGELRTVIEGKPNINDAVFWKGFLVLARDESKLDFIDIGTTESVYQMSLPAAVTALCIDGTNGRLVAGDNQGNVIRLAGNLNLLKQSN